MFSKGYFVRVVNSGDCVVKSQQILVFEKVVHVITLVYNCFCTVGIIVNLFTCFYMFMQILGFRSAAK